MSMNSVTRVNSEWWKWHYARFRGPGGFGWLAVASLCWVTLMASSAKADDTPQPFCTSVSHQVMNVKTFGSMHGLDDTQKQNVRYYVSELQRRSAAVPKRINVLRHPLIHAARPSRLTFILPGARCPQRCAGVAIVPGAEKTEIVKFSYGTTLAVVPPGTWLLVDDRVSERRSSSILFLNADETTLLAFHDVLRAPTAAPEEQRADVAEAVSAGVSVFADKELLAQRGRYENYLACLRNIFDAEGPITDVVPR